MTGDDDVQFDIDMVALHAMRAELAAVTGMGLTAPTTLAIAQQRADLELWSTVLSMTYGDARQLLDTWPEDLAAQQLQAWKAGDE